MECLLDRTFVINLIFSFITGGIWITLATLAADRFGSKIGGFLAGLPSTIVVALFFIAITEGPQMASSATTVMPLTMSVNALFILVYIALVGTGFFRAIFFGLLTWLLLTIGLIMFNPDSLLFSLGAWLSILILIFLVFKYVFHIPSLRRSRFHYTVVQIISRAVFSGSIIVFAVLMSRIGGAVYGGIFSTFPAVFISTIIITYHSAGADFSRAAAKSMVISAFINVVVYAVAVRYFYLHLGLISGTAAGLAISFFSGFLTIKLIHNKFR